MTRFEVAAWRNALRQRSSHRPAVYADKEEEKWLLI